MPVHNRLTQSYLDHVRAPDLLDTARREIDLAATTYGGRCLSRPAFLDRPGLAQLTEDLAQLHAALTSIPDRLFGGDVGAFARTIGMSPSQVTAVQRTHGTAPSRMGRADLYHDGDAFRLMEVNLGASVGGLDNALLNEALLTSAPVADFVQANGLSYVDTMAALVDTLRTECAVPAGATPRVAVVDTPEMFAQLEPRLRYSARQLAAYGLDVVPCHVGQLELRGGRVLLDGKPVDVIYRLFVIGDLREPAGLEPFDPLLRAIERGEVAVFAPVEAHLYGSKGALALISDEANADAFPAETRRSLDRVLPWTRMVRPGPVTADGERVDLREYALGRREELILKPTLMYGGQGVRPGWSTDAGEWARLVDDAMGGPFVLQRRIRPVTELFPTGAGAEPWVLTWGAFLVAQGYGGMLVRGAPAGDHAVVNLATGATAGCCFHEPLA